MATRRIIVISADAAVGARLASALQPLGDPVDVHESFDPAAAPTLCVIYLDGEHARASVSRLTCRAIAVLPRSNLTEAVDSMLASDRICGVVAADTLDAVELAAMGTRVLAGDLFGLDKVMTPGTTIHARLVGDAYEKDACMSEVFSFAVANGIPRKHGASIEQCIDEMAMNALFDAPVDDRGTPVFEGIPVKKRITLRIDQNVVVQFACDSKQLAISVRDAFGTLARATMLRYLHKCLHADQKIDRKVGGAGVGLYLMLHSATSVTFNVVPGVATEVVCTFARETPKLQLRHFGFFVEDHDVTGALVATPRAPAGAVVVVESPRARAARRSRMVAIAGAVAVVAFAVVAWPRVFGPGKPAPVVEIDSTPSNAAVEVDGKPVGDTPLTLTSLRPDTDVTIKFRESGYRDAVVHVHVPDRGETAQLTQPLVISDELVRVRFVSTPPGARIQHIGAPPASGRTYTPADVFVEANKVQRFMLTMRSHVPVVLEPFTPARGSGPLQKAGTLAAGATLRIEASLDGKATVVGASHCTDVPLPYDCTLVPGRYSVEYHGPSNARVTHEVDVTDEDSIDRFELGFVEAGPGKLLQPGGARKTVFEIGTHTVMISDETGTHTVTVRVTAGASTIVN